MMLVLVDNNAVAPDWGNPFLSDSIVFNENTITSVITALSAALTLMLGVNGSLLFDTGDFFVLKGDCLVKLTGNNE